nr:regulatory protein RecX [Desulfobacula sp.]
MSKPAEPLPKKNNENPLTPALRYLSHQPRSIREIYEYLTKKGFDEGLVLETIEMLKEKEYLNDEIFTRNFVESRINHKPKSKFALAYELNKKGIDSAIIEAALEAYDDRDLALKAVQPKLKPWTRLDGEKFKKKILNFLQYRGFKPDVSISIFNELAQSEQKNTD